MSALAATITEGDERVAVIRTSDRATFKRCRRKWGFSSHLRMNLDELDRPGYFWIGTAGHFALEDYHGYNKYGHPIEALHAFVEAQKKYSRKAKVPLPGDWKELVEMLEGVLQHYLLWSQNRDTYKTLWIQGEPQVEVRILCPLPWERGKYGYDRVLYQGTIDRVVEIEVELWVQDYKFLKSISSADLDFDQQMSSYIWLGSTAFDRPIVGAIYHQFKKAVPESPRILQSGLISTAEHQSTTHGLYREALINMYGEIHKAPKGNVQRLNDMGARESEDRDDFIRRDKTLRNKAQQESEGSRILLEIDDMLNPDLPLYTNPTRDCSWDCGMREVCLMMDRDDHWQALLGDITTSREEQSDEWRQYLK